MSDQADRERIEAGLTTLRKHRNDMFEELTRLRAREAVLVEAAQELCVHARNMGWHKADNSSARLISGLEALATISDDSE